MTFGIRQSVEGPNGNPCPSKVTNKTVKTHKSWKGNATGTRRFISTVQCSTHRDTYLLTPWCRVLLEKLIGLQLVKKFPAFCGTWRFITALTSVRHLSLSCASHLSLSCASPIQSTYPHPTSWRLANISYHLWLSLESSRKVPALLLAADSPRTKNYERSKKNCWVCWTKSFFFKKSRNKKFLYVVRTWQL